ncbi:DUF1735 domain-containing protein [Parabacteroides sp. TM07-1AC]|uniref:DUF1735 domain-containing protein n=1 Tax=Parabacteroides sp. TM07-1AC TaxID=2292363 RepID=UPI000EFEF1F6|nr:DUF1735 domain-containing protein [Parabacteroides sp. TM07-1AC]RHU26287.1 DUF1735 domain-containing protein [Parabacteroides sp. TM07-1AC]
MKHFIYAIFVCLLMLTGCNNEEPGYGYKDPVVYFSRAGIQETNISGSEIPVSVYCSGNPDRAAVSVSAEIDRLLYDSFEQKSEYQLVPESFYTASSWVIDIPKKEQLGTFNIPIQTSTLSAGKYVLPLKLTNSSPFNILKDKDVLYLTFIIE